MADWSRICCAIDFSGPSRAALQRAGELARRLGAALTLLHVHETAPAPASGPLPLHELGEMDAWVDRAEHLAGSPVRASIRAGAPAAEIAAFLREHGFDLVVIGLDEPEAGAGALGPIAAQVIREAPCPVLVAR